MGTNKQNLPDVLPTSADAPKEIAASADVQSTRSLGVERRLLRWILEQLGSAPLKFVLWDGSEVCPHHITPECAIYIQDRGALWRLIGNAEYAFPAMFVQGRIGLGAPLEQILEIIQRARRKLDPNSLRRRFWSTLRRPRPGSLRHARENIQIHYDVGNDFYRLWLDEQMVYTCAYFPSMQASLEEAQRAKMDLVCRKLRLKPGERVVEAGCGWGAFALHMAGHYGVKVRAFNISKSQLAFARERAKREGLDGAVEFVEDDYREIDGSYDAFVSVGMLEHVGRRQYPELGQVMDRCLPAHGRGLIHTIGTDRPGPLNSWIERHIFPGAYPPSLGEMMPLFGPNGFSILDVENLRLHYALTLKHWRERFLQEQDNVLEMFDTEFVRAWLFYLASSESAFSSGHLQLFQVVFARKGCNEIPWTRAELYRDGAF
jgi:cyclopropane-fatty-acyl-phospholipid synthase